MSARKKLFSIHIAFLFFGVFFLGYHIWLTISHNPYFLFSVMFYQWYVVHFYKSVMDYIDD